MVFRLSFPSANRPYVVGAELIGAADGTVVQEHVQRVVRSARVRRTRPVVVRLDVGKGIPGRQWGGELAKIDQA